MGSNKKLLGLLVGMLSTVGVGTAQAGWTMIPASTGDSGVGGFYVDGATIRVAPGHSQYPYLSFVVPVSHNTATPLQGAAYIDLGPAASTDWVQGFCEDEFGNFEAATPAISGKPYNQSTYVQFGSGFASYQATYSYIYFFANISSGTKFYGVEVAQ
jgi:hypothetical protein